MNIYQQAAVKKIRFESARGQLTVEQLFDLPLVSKSGFDLDSVAKAANSTLKAMAEESFVQPAATPGRADAELRLELVKDVIAYRMAENRKRLEASQRSAEREKLLSALERRQEEELSKLTPAEIQARIDALDGK